MDIRGFRSSANNGGLAATYFDHVRIIIEKECQGLDSVYEDYLVHLIGMYGLRVLLDTGCLETCGVINGRQLYTIKW